MILERFGTTLQLPILDGEQDIGTGNSASGLVALPSGGGFDTFGSGQVLRRSRAIAARGIIQGTPAERQTQFDALRAMRGKRDKLYARTEDGGVRWTWARLMGLSSQRGTQHVNHLDVGLNLELQHPIWFGARHGLGWLWADGTEWDSGAAWNEAAGDTFTITHSVVDQSTIEQDGNANVDNAVLTFTAGSAAITGFTLISNSTSEYLADLTYSGTIAATHSLVMDSGAQSITISTALSANAAAAATSLTVTSSASFVVGYPVFIVLNNGRIHHTTIATLPDATHLTIDDPLPSAAATSSVVSMSAYNDLSFGDNHRLGSTWFRIVPAPDQILVNIELTSTQDATLTVAFSDGWE